MSFLRGSQGSRESFHIYIINKEKSIHSLVHLALRPTDKDLRIPASFPEQH